MIGVRLGTPPIGIVGNSLNITGRPIRRSPRARSSFETTASGRTFCCAL
jgi:hypothetical protein